jgi:rhodanese-related sulfurtransferase
VKFIVDNLFLFGIALLSGAALLWPVLTKRAGGASLTTVQATQMINKDNAALLDVRSADEFARGHVAQAKNVPLESLESTPDSAGKKDKPVILMCQNGQKAGKAAAILRKAGFTQVFSLQGGLAGWQTAGLPVIKK